ncbi:23S rRNA (adenine(2503)-C(2))-methyltransferase RlmN [Alkalitalea saponilacus]|uniref:Probable dual-specificity RNA methyltransferase RlmN n=1 Tax=Alkalitalea saponilacus TaxID=889453 RepID=A0A1T5CHK4_9BACT|nr:23S rRNA (adenine(2503)-C(2))-methyltransferase RlmN [Alkalitalea saponilacus]ASB49871.1 23S rRNA (adenine(2503)-C(2))-methyltransferase RlmN [Alkalitalea saponilacus]SKB58927.1 23S rRNA (adenine2503-C2)-methyltransferase [Alkalitalea saponilacus]
MQNELLYGKTLNELKEIVKQHNLPGFTAGQIADWLYKKRAESIDSMTNLSKKARQLLSENFETGVTLPSKVQESVDGTKKYLFPAHKHLFIEAAYIPEDNRKTLCISSQVGCKMGCLFCMTGKQGFQSQLTAGEILNQIRSIPESEELTNVVYMGMGEPLDNIEEVLKSLDILTSDWGYGWSPRRINVSTIGIVPAMRRFIEESEAHLAISLHTPFNEERQKLMPIEQVYSIEQVIETLREYDFGRQRRISFEYIMFEGINDTPAHVKGLTKILNGIRCRINLIKFHPIPDSPLRGTPHKTMQWFCDQLNNKGITTTIRRSRGEDIYAACGLLSTKALLNDDKPKDY